MARKRFPIRPGAIVPKRETLDINPFKIIKYILVTDKAIELLHSQNTLTLIVDRKANKPMIKRAVEALFDVRVEDVRTLITPRGEKKAYVKLAKEYSAVDIASTVGIL